MAYILFDYFQKHGHKIVEARLRGIVGKALPYVTDDDHYRQYVTQRAWSALPLPIRMLNRHYLRWDEYCLALRNEVFDLTGGHVEVRPDMPGRVAALAGQFFGPASEPNAVSTAGVSADRIAVGISTATPHLSQPSPQHAEENGVARAAEGPGIAVGIDLGTTFSVIAHVDASGRPCSIPNAAGDLLTPSVVLFEEGGAIVGKEAVLASAMEPEKTAACVKRDMGAKVYRKQINGEYLPPEVISSFILRSLKADAERKLGPVHMAVITVPAYFDETRRRATMNAGRLAGLHVLDIINEPTAAALAYGHQLGFLDRSCRLPADEFLRILVYDLGGGTFDVTIVEIKGQSLKALATDGDVCLGGKDWDEKLMGIAVERFRQQYREDPRENPVSRQELWLAAEFAKRTLTERSKTAIFVNHLGSRLKVEVTRADFEAATAALLERTRLTTEIVVRQAGLTWSDIDRVLLVGGSTRMPMVPRMLQELTGKSPDRSLSVDEAVAHGAALYADLLTPRKGTRVQPARFEITNINSHSLGILGAEVRSGKQHNKILIPKNSPLPRTIAHTFKTLKPNQRSVQIKVLEGESDHPEECSQVGVCAIHDLPADLPAGWPVQVSYTYESNGRLHVTAKLKGHTAAVTTDFVRENSLPDDDVELWAHFVQEEMSENSRELGRNTASTKRSAALASHLQE